MEVDPATHDAVIAALGKVCAVTHPLLRSKGSEAMGAPVLFSPTQHCTLHRTLLYSLILVALCCSYRHVVYPGDCGGRTCYYSPPGKIA